MYEIANAAGTTTLARYTYLGDSTAVKVEHPAVTNGLTLDYDVDADRKHSGFGRLGNYEPSPICEIGDCRPVSTIVEYLMASGFMTSSNASLALVCNEAIHAVHVRRRPLFGFGMGYSASRLL